MAREENRQKAWPGKAIDAFFFSIQSLSASVGPTSNDLTNQESKTS